MSEITINDICKAISEMTPNEIAYIREAIDEYDEKIEMDLVASERIRILNYRKSIEAKNEKS